MNIFERILCFVIFAVGAGAILVNFAVLKRGIRGAKSEIYIYYTNLSNIAVILYHTVLFIASFYRDSKFYKIIFSPVLRLSVTLIILMTFIIYHFVLRSADKHLLPEANTSCRQRKVKIITNLCVHYVVPLLTFAEWVIFANKESLKITDGIIWVIFPLIYIAFISFRAKVIGNNSEKKKYPYFFIDADVIGRKKVAVNIVVIGVVSVIFGMLFVFITGIFI